MRKHLITVQLQVEAFDDEGKLIDKRIVNEDLVLDNWGKLWQYLFREWYPFASVDLIDINGSTIGIAAYGDNNIGRYQFNSMWGDGKGAKITIGSDSTTPTRSDYCLGNPISTQVAEPSTWTSSTGRIEFLSTFYLGSVTTLREAGFIMNIRERSTSDFYNILMFRNTFGAIAAKTFTIKYIMQF